MGSIELIGDLKKELLAAEEILNREYSFDLAEPNYVHCLDIILAHPDMRAEFVASLISLYEAGDISDEPVAYLMHVLRWPEVAVWAEESLRTSPNPIATGASLEKVLAAYEGGWENREFYKHL